MKTLARKSIQNFSWENKKDDLCKYVLKCKGKRLASLRFKKPDSFTARAFIDDTEYAFHRTGTFFNVMIYLDEVGINRPVAMIKKRYWYDQSNGDILFEDGRRYNWRIFNHPLATLRISNEDDVELIRYSYNNKTKGFESITSMAENGNHLHLLLMIIGWYLTPRSIVKNAYFNGTVESFFNETELVDA